jgi:dimethylglycine catabolism A
MYRGHYVGRSERFNTNVQDTPDVLASFDRVVIATGARYRLGLGGFATSLLDLGLARWPVIRQVFSSPRFRDWFYYRGRRGTAKNFRGLMRPGQKVVAIGDAVRAGKSKEAIASAFSAALLEPRPMTGKND